MFLQCIFIHIFKPIGCLRDFQVGGLTPGRTSEAFFRAWRSGSAVLALGFLHLFRCLHVLPCGMDIQLGANGLEKNSASKGGEELTGVQWQEKNNAPKGGGASLVLFECTSSVVFCEVQDGSFMSLSNNFLLLSVCFLMWLIIFSSISMVVTLTTRMPAEGSSLGLACGFIFAVFQTLPRCCLHTVQL